MSKTTTSPLPADETVVAPLPALPPVLARLGRMLVYLAIVLGPLLALPPNTVLVGSLETPRRLALFLCGGLLLALLVFSWARRGRIVWRAHPLDLPVALFTLAAVVCSLASAYPFISVWGPLWSHDGLLFLLIGVPLYVGAKEFLRTPEEINRAMTLMAIVGGVAAALGIGDFMLAHSVGGYEGYNHFFAGKRLMGPLGNPMFAGTYFLLIIPLAAVGALLARTPARRWLLAAVLLLALGALLLTQARAAWVALALSVPVFLLIISKLPGDHRAISRAVWAAIILGAVLVGGVVAGVPTVRARLASMVNMDDETTSTRFVYMAGARNLFYKRPAQGWGVGTVRTVFPQHRLTTTAREAGMALNRAYATAQPHNLLLQVAAEMGLLGLAAFAFLLVLAARTALQALNGAESTRGIAVGLTILLLAYLLVNQFAFDNAATLSLFWLALGLLAALTARDTPLAARLGGLQHPLTPRAVNGVAIAALVIALGTLLHTASELVAARLTLQAMQHAALGKALVYRDGAAAYRELRTAEALLGRSRYFTVALDPRKGVWYGDTKTYQLWTDVCYNQLQMLQPDPETFNAEDQAFVQRFMLAERNFADASGRGLWMIDRDYLILRFQVQKHLLDAEVCQRFGDEEGLRAAKSHAETVLAVLQNYEPHSAELDLMNSSIQKVQGEAAEARFKMAMTNLAAMKQRAAADAELLQAQAAAERDAALSYYSEAQVKADLATRKDPTFPEAYAQLADMESRQWDLGSPVSPMLVPDICRNYARAELLELKLSQDDLYAYAEALFAYGLDANYRADQVDPADTIADAIAHGRQLQPERRAELKARVSTFYRLYGLPAAAAQAVLAALDAGAPRPAPQPAPTPAVPAFPGVPTPAQPGA